MADEYTGLTVEYAVKTTGDQSIDGNKTFLQNIIVDGVTSTNFTASADITATGKVTAANFDIDALTSLP